MNIPVLPLTIVVDREAAINHNVMKCVRRQDLTQVLCSSEENAKEIAARIGTLREVRILTTTEKVKTFTFTASPAPSEEEKKP